VRSRTGSQVPLSAVARFDRQIRFCPSIIRVNSRESRYRLRLRLDCLLGCRRGDSREQ
jgi:hypothetical protein